MARLPENGIPAYRLHKSKGLALVTLDGRDIYLGKHGTPESRAEYDRLIHLWLANDRRLPDAVVGKRRGDRSDVVVSEVIAAYWEFAEKRYAERPATLYHIKAALKLLRKLFGPTPVVEFGPKALRTFQRAMLEEPPTDPTKARRRGPLSRKVVNYSTQIVKAAMKWAKNEELIDPSVYEAIRDVGGLRKGETIAREARKIRPVGDDVVEATMVHLPEVVRDMIFTQRYTGARPAEVCAMTPRDIDTSGPVWKYVPRHHKTEIHDKDRTIYIGPKVQAVLSKYLVRALDAALFSPREAEDQRRTARRARRKTRVQPSQQNRRLQFPTSGPGERYDTTSYRRAIARACDAAFPHPTLSAIPFSKRTAEQRRELSAWQSSHRWAPNRLRHARATEVRREFGLDAAQATLGHSRVTTTQIYCEVNEEKAVRAALATG
jgi:integrase